MTTVNAPVCELCDGTKFRPSARDPRRYEHCECVRKARIEKGPDGVPLEFRKAALATYRSQPGNKTALASAKRFLAEGATGDLYLAGPVGSGKTHLACAVLNAHFAAKGDGLFVRTPRLMLDLQLTYGPNADPGELKALLDRLFGVSLLVLDDVGVEKGSEHTFRTLYTVYEERHDRGLRTVFTSNLGLKELAEFLSDIRLSSRIAQRADVVFLNCADQRPAQRRLREATDGD